LETKSRKGKGSDKEHQGRERVMKVKGSDWKSGEGKRVAKL
jgi:hypothetical protein